MSVDLADRPPLDQVEPAPSVSAVLARGAAVAVWVCLASFGVVAAPVLIAWLGAGASEPISDALSVAGLGWLAALGSTLSMPDMTVDLTPLGLTLVVVLLACRGGLWAGEGAVSATGTRVATLLAATALTAGVVAGVAATLVASDTVAVDPGDAATHAGLLTLTGTALGVRSIWWAGISHRVPRVLALAWRPTLAAASVLLALAAGVTTVTLVSSFGEITSLLDQLDPGAAGMLALLLACLAYLPTLLVWVLAVAVGPGVSVGAVVSVGGAGVDEGALPGFPLLALVPDSVPAWLTPVGLTGVVAAGALAGLVAHRASAAPSPASGAASDSSPSPWWEPVAAAVLAGVAVGITVAFAAWAASGSMGPGDLSWAGVEPLVGVTVGLAVTASASATAGTLSWRRRRQSPSRDASESFNAS